MGYSDASPVELPGPWTHRTISANGSRFHCVEAGDGPLVVLVHGFPEFWWTWHRQLASLPAAGFRTVAIDLRGYGGSDKPPRGYDLITLASDVAGLVRALGEANAVVVGHDWGGLLAWTIGVYRPKVVRRIAVVSAPHPLRMRAASRADPAGQGWVSRYRLGFQLPMLPERQLVRNDAALVGRILRSWSRPGWPDDRTEALYRQAIAIPGVAHCSMEYYRWMFRSRFRPDGLRYARAMRAQIQVPTLHLHGAQDPNTLPRSAQGSGAFVAAPYRWRLIDGAGHFPQEERPDHFDAELIGWLRDPEPDR